MLDNILEQPKSNESIDNFPYF